MALFDEAVTKQLTEILAMMKDEIDVVFFVQEMDCPTCQDGLLFFNELAAMNSKLKLTTISLDTSRIEAEKYRIDKVPAVLLLDRNGQDTRVRFFGIPAGYEINSFLGAILEISGQKMAIPQDIKERIDKINFDVHIQVFISLGCPHCPDAVSAAHLLAIENSHIRADMVETSTFPQLSDHYNVVGVPKSVFNDKIEFVGSQPVVAYLDMIDKLAGPESVWEAEGILFKPKAAAASPESIQS